MKNITTKIGSFVFVAYALMNSTIAVSVEEFLPDFNNDRQGNPIKTIGIDSQREGIDCLDMGSMDNSLPINISARVATDSLGFFNNNCLHFNSNNTLATSNNEFAQLCNTNDATKDYDLAMGQNNYNNITFNSQPQGNLLILEENLRDSILDKTDEDPFIMANFDCNTSSSVILGDNTFINKIERNIEINFINRKEDTVLLYNLMEENQLFFISEIINPFEDIADQINLLSINKEITSNSNTNIPEPSPLIGIGMMVTLGLILNKKKQDIKQNRESSILK